MNMKNEGGFTLIEILAGIVILGFVLTVFFQFFMFSQKTTTNNKDQLIALNAAETMLERIVENRLDYRKDIKQGTYPRGDAGGKCLKPPSKDDKYYINSSGRKYYAQLIVQTGAADLGLSTVIVQVCGENGDAVISEVQGLVDLE